jgi:glucose-1-phosphate thymidylyltransferase
MLAGVREILIICDLDQKNNFVNLLGNGSQFGISFEYETQLLPKGIGEGILIAKDFIKNEKVALILGDNIFYGQGFTPILKHAIQSNAGATIFGYKVKDPERFGVVLRHNNIITKIVEKPKKFLSNEVITGIYSFPKTSMQYFKNLKKSLRGETEITDVLLKFKNKNKLHVEKLGKGHFWMDVGTPESLLEAANFISIVQKRQGLKIADIYSLI